MNRQRVYRAGLMTPGVNAGAAKTVTEQTDALRPHHVGRNGSLFASPTLEGSVRWVLGNSSCRYNTRLRELTVDADTTLVYRVRSWEEVVENDTASMQAYWATGMTLTAWLTANLDSAEWEALVSVDDVLALRNVSPARLLGAAPQWREPELKRIVKDWRYAA